MEIRMSSKDMNIYVNNDDYNLSNNNCINYLKDKNSNFADIFENDNWNESKITQLIKSVKLLDERSKYIIYSRWLNSNKKITLQELAKRFNVSAERIRQIEKNAMKKLKNSIISDNI